MAFLTKSLPRRTVLKGIGTTMALPFLDAMLPPLRAAAKPAHRFQAFYVPNGMAMEYWTPKGEGTAFELNRRSWSRWLPYKDQMLVFSGHQGELELHPCGRFRIVSDRHAARRTQRNRDHRRRLHRPDARQALRAGNAAGVARALAWTRPANAGACTGNLSCAYLDTLSLAQPHAAAADGVESAHRIREAVRRQRQHGSRARANATASSTRAFWIR